MNDEEMKADLMSKPHGSLTGVGGTWDNPWCGVSSINVLQLPKHGEWEGVWLGITFTPLVGDEPNWFRRVATRWVFGVKWRRVTK